MRRESKASLRHRLHIEREKRRAAEQREQVAHAAGLNVNNELERAHAYIAYVDERMATLLLHDEMLAAILQRAGEVVEFHREDGRSPALDEVKIYESALEYARQIRNDGVDQTNNLRAAYYAGLEDEGDAGA